MGSCSSGTRPSEMRGTCREQTTAIQRSFLFFWMPLQMVPLRLCSQASVMPLRRHCRSPPLASCKEGLHSTWLRFCRVAPVCLGTKAQRLPHPAGVVWLIADHATPVEQGVLKRLAYHLRIASQLPLASEIWPLGQRSLLRLVLQHEGSSGTPSAAFPACSRRAAWILSVFTLLFTTRGV